MRGGLYPVLFPKPAASGGPPINSKAAAWKVAVLAAGGTVSAPRLTLVSNLLNTTDAASITAKMQDLWLHAAENSQSALIGIIAQTAASAASGPTFTANQGYTVNGPSPGTYVDLGTPGAAPYTQNGAHFGFWLRNNLTVSENGINMGASSATNYGTNISVKYSDGNCYVAINDDNSDGGRAQAATVNGHWIINRSGASAVQMYQGGAAFATSGVASTAVPTRNFTVGGSYNNSGVHSQEYPTMTPQYAASHLGGSLSSTDATNLFNALQTYMTAVGA